MYVCQYRQLVVNHTLNIVTYFFFYSHPTRGTWRTHPETEGYMQDRFEGMRLDQGEFIDYLLHKLYLFLYILLNYFNFNSPI